MRGDGGVNCLARAFAQPCEEDALRGSAFTRREADNELAAGGQDDRLDRRRGAGRPGGNRDDPDAMELPPVGHKPAILGATARSRGLLVTLELLHVANEPAFALPEKPFDARFGAGPASTARRRHRHDHPVAWIDRHAQPPRATRSAYAILDKASTEQDAVGGLLREAVGMAHLGTS